MITTIKMWLLVASFLGLIVIGVLVWNFAVSFQAHPLGDKELAASGESVS